MRWGWCFDLMNGHFGGAFDRLVTIGIFKAVPLILTFRQQNSGGWKMTVAEGHLPAFSCAPHKWEPRSPLKLKPPHPQRFTQLQSGKLSEKAEFPPPPRCITASRDGEVWNRDRIRRRQQLQW